MVGELAAIRIGTRMSASAGTASRTPVTSSSSASVASAGNWAPVPVPVTCAVQIPAVAGGRGRALPRWGGHGGMASAIAAVVRRAGKLPGSCEQDLGNAQACNEGLEEEVTLQDQQLHSDPCHEKQARPYPAWPGQALRADGPPRPRPIGPWRSPAGKKVAARTDSAARHRKPDRHTRAAGHRPPAARCGKTRRAE